MSKNSDKKFIALVERSSLSPTDKDELCRRAVDGVTPDLWHRFDELLVVDFENRQERFNAYRQLLDQEVVRYTREYEKHKTVIDKEMRSALSVLSKDDRSEQDRLWQSYHKKVDDLQKKLLAEMKKSSKTSLQQVATSFSR